MIFTMPQKGMLIFKMLGLKMGAYQASANYMRRVSLAPRAPSLLRAQPCLPIMQCKIPRLAKESHACLAPRAPPRMIVFSFKHSQGYRASGHRKSRKVLCPLSAGAPKLK
jgi:hypothetical protein